MQNISKSDMTMLAASARCSVLHETEQIFSATAKKDEQRRGEEIEHTLVGCTGGVQSAEGSSRFLMVNNYQPSEYGPRTILLRGGTGTVLLSLVDIYAYSRRSTF